MKREPETASAPALGGWLPVLAGGAVLLALLAGGMVLIPRYQAAHPASVLQRSDADRVAVDDLYLDLTLVTPEFLRDRKLERYLGGREPTSVLPLLVGVNTHAGTIAHMHHLHGELFLIGDDGARYPAVSEPIVLTEHHNAYMILFPPRDNRGRPFLGEGEGMLVVEAVGMGAVPVRRFEWQLPLPAERSSGVGLVATLMLGVALVSALLVVLSPCALELTLYYTAIISSTVAAATGGEAAPPRTFATVSAEERRRVLINLGSFVAGFTLLYSVAGATVGLIGQGVRQPLGEYSYLIQIAGGSLILFFALRVLGLDRRLGAVLGAVLGGLGRRLAASPLGRLSRLAGSGPGTWVRRRLGWLRFQGEWRAARRGSMRPFDSFLVGMGLSSSCLGCMGGAVLYPLLVYAGITSWYSGLITLALYSLGIALPMVAIALGFVRLRASLGHRLGVNRALRLASGAMLGGIGLLILFGRERIMTDLAFRFLGEVSRWAS